MDTCGHSSYQCWAWFRSELESPGEGLGPASGGGFSPWGSGRPSLGQNRCRLFCPLELWNLGSPPCERPGSSRLSFGRAGVFLLQLLSGLMLPLGSRVQFSC